MDFRLLGPLEVTDDQGRVLAIGTGRQRALLALLILRANELVASDRLVDELWGESPPATAPKMLHNQVSALRKLLGMNGRLETHGSAYDGRGQLLSTESWEPVGRPLVAHTGRINSAAFTPDGGTLITAAPDGTAVLSDVKTQKTIGPPLELSP